MTARLGKLVRLLASDKPGEVTAAAAALVRTLQADGLDIHNLAEVVERAALVPVKDPSPPSDKNNSRRYLRGWCARHNDLLSERDQHFLESLASWRGRPTEKQLEWLLDIEARIRRKKRF